MVATPQQPNLRNEGEFMNKAAIQRFAIQARKDLIEQVSQRAYQYGITKDGYGEANAVTVGGRALSADEQKQRKELVEQIRRKGYTQVMEEVAYTWFNRFIALRFMEVNNYLPSHIRVFSDSTGAFKPEILNDVLHLDLPGLNADKVAEFIESNQTEALYRYLLLTQCNALNASLPRMFEQMGGYTELLLPNNILKQDSVLSHMVTDIPEEDWTDQVQIIGWLYQFYNTEVFDSIFDGDMSRNKVTKNLLPAATQLFTPDWAVQYMVQNSLGRIWVEGHPNNDLKSSWKYYLDAAEQKTDVQACLEAIHAEYRNMKPQDIKVIDPCMGSGHILVYAFDVLVQIYKNYGISERDAAQSILENNLYGLDIDDRAAQLAYFAVMMKARQYDRRIFSRGIQPRIYSIVESNGLDASTIEYFTNNNPKLKMDFEALVMELRDAKEYGSILNISYIDFAALYARIEEVRDDISIFREIVLDSVLPLIKVAEVMASKYEIVVTNPPYLGNSRMNESLSSYIKTNYPDEKNDLAMVMLNKMMWGLTTQNGYTASITTASWMFLKSFEKFRKKFLESSDFVSLVDFGTELFDGKIGHLPIVSWVSRNSHLKSSMTAVRLVEYCYSRRDEKEPNFFNANNHFVANQADFSAITGSPVAYWASNQMISAFEKGVLIDETASVKIGMGTGKNEVFLRSWWEINYGNIEFSMDCIENIDRSSKKFFPYNKGGEYRRWYGNLQDVVWYDSAGRAKMFATPGHRENGGKDAYFKPGITWNFIGATKFGVRLMPSGCLFDVAGSSLFVPQDKMYFVMGFLSSSVCNEILKLLNPTVNYQAGNIKSLPLLIDKQDHVDEIVSQNISFSKTDWNRFETSWGFAKHPLVPLSEEMSEQKASQFAKSHMEKFGWLAWHYEKWQQECEERFARLKANEEELNSIFIDIYGLQDELTPEVEDKDVTVRKADLGRDVRSLISYAVGCMFGRYSLDVPGFAYAGGEWDTSKYSTIIPDKDNIIPICDDDYFDDDITGRFVKWVEVVYGKETLEENLKFIADALGGRGTPREVIRNYFLNDFYADHCKIYQKRPIYWLFDSGKKNGFKALIYMHRYQSDLLARLRTDYVHEQQERYRTQLSHLADAIDHASASERVKLTKQQKKIQDQALEIQKYEEKIHHLADQNISIDLDDGVKHNYALFADVLAKIK